MVRVIVTKNKASRAIKVKEFTTFPAALKYAADVATTYKLESLSISEFIIRCLLKD